MSRITANTSVAEIVKLCPGARRIFDEHGLKGCGGEQKPTQPDRTFKFVRGAYVWLLIACGMMPFFPPYGVLTHQVFAHTYMGSHRHAFTVGFISIMILGVSSRVVPILAGIDAKQMNSLWAPFLLFNAGCAGRVVLQVLTDFVPNVATR